MYANIYFGSGRLIAEAQGDGVKYISKLKSYCANITFTDKVDMIDFFRKLHMKEGNQQ